MVSFVNECSLSLVGCNEQNDSNVKDSSNDLSSNFSSANTFKSANTFDCVMTLSRIFCLFVHRPNRSLIQNEREEGVVNLLSLSLL